MNTKIVKYDNPNYKQGYVLVEGLLGDQLTKVVFPIQQAKSGGLYLKQAEAFRFASGEEKKTYEANILKVFETMGNGEQLDFAPEQEIVPGTPEEINVRKYANDDGSEYGYADVPYRANGINGSITFKVQKDKNLQYPKISLLTSPSDRKAFRNRIEKLAKESNVDFNEKTGNRELLRKVGEVNNWSDAQINQTPKPFGITFGKGTSLAGIKEVIQDDFEKAEIQKPKEKGPTR